MKKKTGHKRHLKRFNLFTTILLCMLFFCNSLNFAAKSGKPRFYIKFEGIGSNTKGGDYDTMVNLSSAYLKEQSIPNSELTVTTDEKPYFVGYGGELGFETSTFAVGFSAGYMEKKITTDFCSTK